MANKVTYGLESVYIAFRAADDSSGEPAWETPQAILGAVRFAPEPEGEETKFYADNSLYFVANANNGYKAELEMALIPDAILAEMLGWDTDDNGMLVEVANGTPKKFALMGQIEGDDKDRRFVYYDCQAARPSKEEKTKAESTEPNPDMLPLTIFPIEVDALDIVKGVLELSLTNTAIYNAFFDAVYVPDFGSV